MNKKKLPLVVIFGRTNVGKSTLFNCLTEKRHAITSDIEGTTRDSNIGTVEWQNKKFQIVDTGGIINPSYLAGKFDYLTSKKIKRDDIEDKVQKQACEYLTLADLILFLVDSKTGLLPQDKEMALLLKKILNKKSARGGQEKKIILVANKADSLKQRSKTSEFYKLSLGDPIPVSGVTGSGTGDLLDIITKKIRSNQVTLLAKDVVSDRAGEVSACIIGKPNVGKSSMLNSILGYKRVIVSPIAHTTREPQDTEINYKDNIINLVDTAGISRKGTKTKGLEKYGIEKSLTSLKKTDIALLVLDISKKITHQDAKLVEEIFNRKKSLIIIANKWDLVPERNTKKYTQYIYGKLPFADFAPIQFTSALTGEKVDKILNLVLKIANERKTEIQPNALNKFLNRIVKIHKPAKGKGLKHPRIYEIKQAKTNPPKFELRIGAKDNLHFSYVRFIENRLREKFGFLGTPISMRITKSRIVHGKHEQ
ncbi:MAG: ribosome biogenesis GTPase Der [Candidatus Falkowbacteria bacterium]